MSHFTGVLAVLHTTTPDGRRLDEPDPELTRPLPLPLIAMDGAPAGHIDHVWRDGNLIRYSGQFLAETAHALVEAKLVVGNLDARSGPADGIQLVRQGRALSQEEADALPLDCDPSEFETVMRGWLVAGATLGPSESRAWPEVSLTLAGSEEPTA